MQFIDANLIRFEAKGALLLPETPHQRIVEKKDAQFWYAALR
jgi:hypothetical protein